MLLQSNAPASALDLKTALFVALAVIGVFYLVVLTRGIKVARADQGSAVRPDAPGLITGFVTNFFDTLGIGSFATTTAIFRQWRMVIDEHIPATLNIGHTIPTIAQAYIFTRLVPVDSMTLILMIGAAVIGSWIGAGVAVGWPRRNIQISMGLALLIFSAILLMGQLGIGPKGGTLLKLEGSRLAIGLAGNFVLGALMPLGIGLYGPCMVLIYLLGMDPKAAFPIMMGSCAFLMPVASARFIKEKAFNAKAVLGLAIGGLPAVLIAAFIVKSMPLKYLMWLVLVVVLYTALTLLLAATREKAAPSTA
ncbi:MAG: sulfite exporter TauE/SafE family protein [Gemmatimonadota bacterium]